jgi:hypothetical protein
MSRFRPLRDRKKREPLSQASEDSPRAARESTLRSKDDQIVQMDSPYAKKGSCFVIQGLQNCRRGTLGHHQGARQSLPIAVPTLPWIPPTIPSIPSKLTLPASAAAPASLACAQAGPALGRPTPDAAADRSDHEKHIRGED